MFSFEADEFPARYLSEFGLGDVAVFSTDYPHSDSKYPHATEAFLEMPIGEEMKKAVLWDNCARLLQPELTFRNPEAPLAIVRLSRG